MNKDLQTILQFIQQANNLSDEEKTALLKAAKDANKELEITLFKLERTEKVKHTTSILLEETIEELEQKRKAVEAQNRELEIESSLERVRTAAMAMKEPADMVDICHIISDQLKLLNVKEIRNIQTAIFYEDKGTYFNFEYYSFHKKSFVTEVEYINHPMTEEFANRMLRGSGMFYIRNLQEKELKDWYEFQKTTNQFIDTHLEVASSLNYYWYSLGSIALGISTYAPLSEEEINLFKRFRNVFELSYRRYLDIEKAMAQAKEAKIEAALERVRAVAMAMKKSEELITVCEVMYKELTQLGFTNIRNAQIAIKNDSRQSYLISVYSAQEVLVMQEAPYNSSPIVEELYNQLGKSDNAFYQKEYSGKKFDDWRKWRNALSPLTDAEATATSMCFYLYAIGTGHLGISTFNTITTEQVEILKRFKNVFELSYRRYLDVAQAEAQARESQIELALERIRARTMAMQKSDELAETVFILFQQFKELGENPDQATIGIINEEECVIEYWVTMYGNQTNRVFKFSIDEPNVTNKIYKAWKEQKKSLVIDLSGKELYDFAKYRESMGGAGYNEAEKRRVINVAFFSKGLLNVQSNESRSAESILLLERFAAVFQQTYTRFLDLKNAEAQARESQIQLALERVRARTMAMQKSDELRDAAALLFQQVKSLGVPAYSCGYNIWEKNEKTFTSWMSSEDGSIINAVLNIPLTEDANFIRYVESKQKGEQFFVLELRGERMQEHYQYLKTIPAFKAYFDYAVSVGFDLPETQIHHLANFSQGNLLFITLEPCPEFHDVFKRFAAVFEQTYTRFLDLQKAEAQSRESQIQLGLERVRARAMAMQNSNELSELVDTVFKELTKLDFALTWCIINIIDESSLSNTVWAASPGIDKIPESYYMKFEDYPFHHAMMKGWKERKTKYVYVLEGSEKKTYDEYLFNETEFRKIPEAAQAASRAIEKYVVSFSFSNFGGLQTVGDVPLSDANLDILSRFGKVFDLTYTRFNDLKQAEAQARESQIEAALERVRSRTMAMFKSDELAETSAVLFKQLIQLGIEPNRLYIGVIKDESGDIEAWATDEDGVKVSQQFVLSSNRNISIKKMYDGWKAQKKSVVIDLQGKELENYFHYLNEELHVPFTIGLHQKRRVQHMAYFSKGFIGMAAPDEQSPSTINLLERFAGVFNLTYTRFNDLQKAEAQTREATIEAALEKVRGKAMAMHNSDDLSATASLVFTELRKLGVNPIRSGVGIFNKESQRLQFYSAAHSANGDSLSFTGAVNISSHPEFEKQYESWLKKENYFTVLKGEELESYYKVLSESYIQSDFNIKSIQEQYGHWIMFSEGFLFAWAEAPYNDEEIKILKRFATIIDLTFRRYIELKKSEANTKEAVKQAALDRIRADIASMRKISDLERITPLIWNELTVLGIPFMRCGVFIMDEEQEQIHTFLSAPDGIAIAAFHIPYSTPGNIQDVLHHWKNKKNYINHWDELSFKEFADTLVKQGALTSSDQYLQTIPHGGFHLHFLPFLQGMLYVGNSTRLLDDEIKLIQSVADAFSTAYARYEDFNKLEAAKQQVDKTLVDLKQAQTQLIQSEKMASLGELTAGIAHEIQNPLNFVNNFSEVNKELLAEMKDEINKGNIDEVKFIADDIIANEEKINHHGKRADAIVKGMLQHSRSSTSQKELTNINALADEYLRLAYHGLRAKDKSFNATLKTDFDNSVGKINIIPQDIGRVLLNLYNNAFYAVAERRKVEGLGYKPAVSVITKKINNKVVLTVMDNGNGIPQKVIDKIFQPFFTTKPTGQGTGLGLSLSYDIIKAHGAEIKVETKEGEGSEFIIQLPVV